MGDRSQTEWNLALALVRSTISHMEAARVSFELVQQLIVDGPEQCISVDNIPGLVAVLDDFATAAGIVVQVEQQHTRRHPKLDSTKSALCTPGVCMHLC
jgi:golgi-specific brefeldin A-resistance guanine nucleotide exchange factor 1